MITASPQYRESLRSSHTARLRVKLYTADGLIGQLPVVSLSLRIDGKAAIRRTGTIEIALDPFGTQSRDIVEQINVQAGEVNIEHGIEWPGEPTEWIQIARMRIGDMARSYSNSTRRLELYDRALLVQEYKFLTPWPMDILDHKPPTPRPYLDLIQQATEEAIPGTTVIVDPTLSTTKKPKPEQAFPQESDRLEAIITMADALGADYFNDNQGNFVLVDATPATTSVWEIDAGATGVIVGLDETYSRQEQYNIVGLTITEDDEFEAYIIVEDRDPESPTYYLGPFGKRPIFLSHEYSHLPKGAAGEEIAADIAEKKLRRYKGSMRSLSLATLYNPLLQPLDRVTVVWPDSASEIQVIDSMELQFGSATTMSLNTRLDVPDA